MSSLGDFLIVAAVLALALANAQRADDNAVTAAEDAFGSTLGEEKIGLYTTDTVRGFSPIAAGNVRIEGLYFDQYQTWLPPRLVEGSTIHVGVRWKIRPDLQLVAGLFEVEKPYFTTNENNVFTTFGLVSHRGLEFSLAGAVSERISAVLGAVLMEQRVSGAAVEAGGVGGEAVRQTDRVLKANFEYRTAFALSFDVALANVGARIASADNHSRVPGYMPVDVGARYRVKIGNAPATLRVQVANLTDAFRWYVVGSNSFGLIGERRFFCAAVRGLLMRWV